MLWSVGGGVPIWLLPNHNSAGGRLIAEPPAARMQRKNACDHRLARLSRAKPKQNKNHPGLLLHREEKQNTHTTHNPLMFFLRVSTLYYSHPAPPAAPPLPPAGCPSRPVSAPAGPGRRSPAPGRRAIRTNTPTPPANTHTHTKWSGSAKRDKKREDEWME